MPSPAPTRAQPSAVRRWLFGAVLVAAAVIGYLPSLPGDFIWDDNDYVTENRLLREESGLRDIWSPPARTEDGSLRANTPQYYPVVFTAFWIAYRLWELEPLGYHLLNLAVHALNALLVWRLLERLRLRSAWVVGVAFAVHPLHVETVAWVMELKNVLSAAFYLVAAGLYLRFDGLVGGGLDAGAASVDDGRGSRRLRAAALYGLAAVAFVLALLSKSVTFSLPPALFLALVFLRRPLRWRRLVPLVPLFAIGMTLALSTAALEAEHVGARGAAFDFHPLERLLVACRALVFYAVKLVAPWPLLFNYPRWTIDVADPVGWTCVALVAAAGAAGLWAFARGCRGPFLALAYFAGSLSPALGFVDFYPMLYSFVADHFCYLASIGGLALVAEGLRRLSRRPAVQRALLGAWLAGLTALTSVQSHHFRGPEPLYRHTLAHHPESWLAHSTLGSLLLNRAIERMQRGDFGAAPEELEEAREHFTAALAIDAAHPQAPQVHFNLALACERLGDRECARQHALRAADGLPKAAHFQSLAGRALLDAGDAALALPYVERARDLAPHDPFHAQSLGDVHRALGEPRLAEEHYRDAYARAPDSLARLRAGSALASLLATSSEDSVRDPEEALGIVRELEALAPGIVPDLLVAKVAALAELGRWKRAETLAELLLESARRTGREELVRAGEERLARVRARRTLRE